MLLNEDKSHGPLAERSRRTSSAGKPIGSLILQAVPEDEFKIIVRSLEYVDLPQQFLMYESGAKISHAYFLSEGLASQIVALSDGRTVEVGIVGKESLIGAPVAVKLERSPYRVIIQISGNGFRIKSQSLEDLLESTPVFRFLIHRAAQLQGQQFAQIAACNRLHELEQRLARWLLMSQDRLNADWLPITHDFLATMLGTGRPSVTISAGNLQKAGLIEYTRGAVKILDRRGLEEASCECYRNILHFSGAAPK